MAKRLITFLVFVSVISLIGAANCWAQASGTILGNVADPQSAAVPNATVVARNLDTGIERSTLTTAEGYYTIPNLASGVYDVRVEAAGFAKAEAKGIKLQVGELRNVNFKLVLAGARERVVVTAETPLVETTKTDTSLVVDQQQLEGLPLLTGFTAGIGGTGSPLNDYASLAATAPGARFDFTGNSFEVIGPGAYNDRGNLFNIDGGNIIDQTVSVRDLIGASLSEVKEFQVITNNYDAAYGQAGTLIINIITKSGTNEIHGEAHADFRGRNLAASNWLYNALNPDAAVRRAPFQKYIWGAQAGGPFIKDRTFWFLNIEKGHQLVPQSFLNQPPDFRSVVTIAQPTNELLWTVKFDHEITKANHLMVRFNEDRQIANALVQISPFAEPLNGSLIHSEIHDHTLNVGGTSNITPHLVNEGRFFWHRFVSITPDGTATAGNSYGVPVGTTLAGASGPNFYSGAAFCCPQGARQHRYQGTDNLTYVHGTHTFKTGFDVSHFPYFSLFQQFHFGRYAGFKKASLTNPPGNGLPGCANNSTTCNRPTSFRVGLGPGATDARDNIYGLYVQDSWKVRPNVTLNYGLRYDVEDGAFKGGTLDKPGGGCFQGNGIISSCGKDHNNVQPRFGLAWSPRFDTGFLHWVFGSADRSVIRASVAEVTELAYLNIVLDSLNFDGVTLLSPTIRRSSVGSLGATGAQVLAFFPNVPPASLLAQFKPANFFGRIRPISDDLRNPETRHYSLTVTRQFANDFVFEVAYVGVQGFGQPGERDRNFPVIAPDPANPGFFYFQLQPQIVSNGQVTARPDNRFASIRMNANERTSAYHGLLLKVQKRFSHHFQFQANYAFSKTLASVEDFYGTSEPGSPFNIHADRSVAQNDARHVANFTFVFDSANFTQRPILNHILNNITIGWIGTLQSGRPYPISTGEEPYVDTAFASIGAETQQRPNVLPDGTLIATNIPSDGGANLLISEAGAAACVGCVLTTHLAPADADPRGPQDSVTGDIVDFQTLSGNLGRNAGKTNKFYRLDVSIAKSFKPIKTRETFQITLRAEIINILNHPNFLLFNGADTLDLLPVGLDALGNADPTCTSCIRATGPLLGRYIGSGGQVLTVQSLRSGRVSKDIANPVFGGLGDPTSVDDPRTIQLSFRIRW